MKNRQNSNAAYYVCMIIIALFLGCTVEQTHKTLVFFFDGVDKMNFLVRDVSKDSVNRDATAKREALLKKNRPDLCVHQPYKEKKCNECHTPDKRLLMPMPGLCFKCHKSFNETYAVVHGPVASGNCMYCHNQHYSKFPKLLIRQGQQICLFCHSSTMVFASKVHRDIEDAECTTCHNPHGGKTRFMIKDNISRDANRIAIMDNLTYRHLYGQVVSNIAGIINKKMEIEILDSRGNLVATVHPDLDGKFYMANLHPDQNYTFRF
jgi:predicted CXXCH cytochrome family protein